MGIPATLVKELREKTGVGMMDCKRALEQAKGDSEAALKLLRQQGLASAQKKVGRQTKEGLIASYIHPGGRIGVLVEVNCETDFVARNETFKEFVKDVTMHIAAAKPLYLQREDVPEQVVANEKEIFLEQAKGKPEKVMENIVKGKLEKYYSQVCLMEQAFVKDPNICIKDYLTACVAKVGENIRIRRFTRYQLGEEE